jgi:hypothetical protein
MICMLVLVGYFTVAGTKSYLAVWVRRRGSPELKKIRSKEINHILGRIWGTFVFAALAIRQSPRAPPQTLPACASLSMGSASVWLREITAKNAPAWFCWITPSYIVLARVARHLDRHGQPAQVSRGRLLKFPRMPATFPSFLIVSYPDEATGCLPIKK